MKTHLISLRSLAFFCISSALCATMPPPENGLADLIAWKWTSISAKRLEILPEGALKDEYTHTDGEDVPLLTENKMNT